MLAVAWLGMLVFAGHACTHMVAAGDTWVAMACGRHFVNHGVDTVEPFSVNSHKPGPTLEEVKTWPAWAQWITEKVGLETVKKWYPTGWVNQNWLTHVIFYRLTTAFGSEQEPCFDALVIWKLVVYLLAVACIYFVGRVLGAHPLLSAAFACLALFVGRSFLDIRPAGFSNLLVPVFVLILALATYRHILYIWLIVPVTVVWANLHGGYVYVFIVLVPFMGLHLLSIPFRKALVSIGWKGLAHAAGAYVAAFVAMVVFNPFHLTNLTHTFIISISKNAERWRDVHEWHRAFDWSNPVGTAVPFLVMYVIAWVAMAAWIVVQTVTSRSVESARGKGKRKPEAGQYPWPRIDLAMWAVAAMTIYMAVRSRRFIPIAAFAACPVLAMLTDQIIRSIAAARQFHRTQRLVVPAMPTQVQVSLVVVCLAVVLGFGTWAAIQFKYVYLDPWPPDARYSSIFMRMTASFLKPFEACKFIRDNHLSGNMMNYWTEGGFIAWGEQPDPNTGRTPLQLFMDGRAQAAYDTRTFDEWSYIWAGGDPAKEAQMRDKPITTADLPKIGQWAGQRLRAHGVWVVLVPAQQFEGTFARGLQANPEWPLVYIDNNQKLYVDLRSEQGRRLFEGIKTGQTVYPGDFTKNLNLAYHHLVYDPTAEAKSAGLQYAVAAYRLIPSAVPMFAIVNYADRYPDLRPQIKAFCEDLYQDFEANRGKYAQQDGYTGRLESARMAADALGRISLQQKNSEAASRYSSKVEEYHGEREFLREVKKW